MAPSRQASAALAATQVFCRDVLAGQKAGLLPESEPARAEVLRLLAAHRLLGLWLAEAAAGSGADASGEVPGNVRSLVTLQALRGGFILDAAERAHAALRRAGFQVLFFKGVGLVRAGVYPDCRARAMEDADLLVRGGAAAAAVAAMEQEGFAPWVPWQPGRETWLPSCTFSDGRAPAEMEVTVDLHWRIPYGAFRSGDEGAGAEIWEGADPEAATPAPETHALLVAEHFVRHLRVVPHLVGIADLVRLLPRIRDPRRLRELAGDRRSLRLLRTMLWFVRAELGVPLDPALADVVEVPARVGTLRSGILRLDRVLAVPEGRRQGRVEGLAGQALIQGSPRELALEALRVLHPPGEWLARRAGPGGAGGAMRRRLGYSWELIRWAAGRGPSPLSPNQEFEGPTGRH